MSESAVASARDLFPTLTSAQLERLAASGTKRRAEANEVLAEPGTHDLRLFVVLSGELEIARTGGPGPEVAITRLGPGQFSGEGNLLVGRPGLVRARATRASELLEIDREKLLALIQLDSDVGTVLMRTFILRRVELIARGLGDTVLLGSDHCAHTLQAKEFLTRNGHPYTFVDLDRADDVQQLLDRFHVSIADVPVLVCGEHVLRNPSLREIADCLGFNETVDATQMRDLVVVGAGPAGLAAAVYGASEGLDVLVLESRFPGGQAGSSSRIENYLGFPTGISGQDLGARAYAQAQKFGAQILVAESGQRLACAKRPYAIDIGEGRKVLARTVILATGASYRKPAIENLVRFEGAGVYYGATFMEAQLCKDEPVIVVGGGNSAGQAAVFLAEASKQVRMLVRRDGLADTMSRYLIRRIEGNPAIGLVTRAEIVALEGESHVERVQWRDHRTGGTRTEDVRHVFIMAGADPNSSWLDGCVALDARKFVKTGTDLTPDDLAGAHWPLARPPHLLETSLPGVFAVGDLRSGNVKRVAPAVGEGSMAVAFVHRALHE